MTIIVFKRSWTVHWYWVVVNLFVVMILMSLSYWQWQRAIQKQGSVDRLAHWQAQPAASLAELFTVYSQQGFNLSARDGMSVSFSARWVSPFVWLLDNQLLNGRPGYDVIVPVQEQFGSTQSIVLLNLGWVAAPVARSELPVLKIPDTILVQGIYRARADALLLGRNLEDLGRWPMRIQKLDNNLMARYLPAGLLPGLVYQQLAVSLPEYTSFAVHYRPVVMPPERHKAYALQWLLLAIAAVLVGLACANEKTTDLQCESTPTEKLKVESIFKYRVPENSAKKDKISARSN